MYRSVIIEDQKIVREAFILLLERYCPGVISIIGFAASVKDAIALINEEKPEVIFMDIKIEGGTAFDVLNKIEHKDFHLIFTTAFEKHAMKAFKYSAIDYLLKPIDIEELIRAVKKIDLRKSNVQQNGQLSVLQENLTPSVTSEKKRLVLFTHNGIHIVLLSKIVRIEANGPYTIFLVCNNDNTHNKITVSRPIGDYEEILYPFNFIRIHNSHIINLDYLLEITKDGMALLTEGSMVPISKRKKDEFLSLIKKISIQKID